MTHDNIEHWDDGPVEHVRLTAHQALEEAVENVVASKFQFGCTTDILRLRAERLVALAQQKLYDDIVAAVRGLEGADVDGTPDDWWIRRADVLTAIAPLDPRGGR